MKTHHALLISCILLITSIAYSQQIEVQDYERKLTYTEFETDYYLIDQKDLDRISLIDKVKLKEVKSEKEYEKYINENDEHNTIIRHISSSGTYENWMEEPELVLIDKDAVSLYNFKGEIINKIAHAPKYLELAKDLRSDLLPVISFPNKEDLNEMARRGVEIEDLGNSFIQFSYNNHSVIFNEDQLYVELQDLNENGEVIHSIQRNYMQLPNGKIAIERIRESTKVTLQNEIEAEHVFLRIFSSYRYENVFSQADKKVSATSLNIILNSNQTSAKIKYTPFSKQNYSDMNIYNVSGRLMKSFKSDHSGSTELDISDLSPGVYILRLQSSEKTLSEKFIKL